MERKQAEKEKTTEKKGGDNYRVTLDFSAESKEYIKDLQKMTDIKTKAELFRQALNIFDFIVHELSEGCKFVVIKADNTEKEVLFPIMIPSKRSGNK